ncbi:MAG: hypothetical protein ACEPOV_03055 [Hyphomicrobiales bacterium]
MKRLIIMTSIFSFVLSFLATDLVAQDHFDAYKFNKNDKYFTIELGSSPSTKVDEKYTKDNELGQCFIVRRLDNKNCLIAASSDFDLFLKRSDDGTVSIEKIEGDDTANFEWRLDYAGYPFFVIANPSDPLNVVSVGEDGSVKLIKAEALSDNSSTDNFRFKLSTSENIVY